MKAKNFITFLMVIILFGVFNMKAQEVNQKSVSVTIYNSDLGVVRDFRNIDVKRGRSKIEISDVAQQIDPSSVLIDLEGRVLEQNYQYDLVSLEKILKRYIGKDIQMIGENGELIEGKLLSPYGGQFVLQKKEGGLLMFPNLSKFQISVGELPEGLITKPTLVWLVESEKEGRQNTEITYQTKGLTWEARYVALLNENDTSMNLTAWVNITNNSGATYRDASVKLVAGDVNQIKETNYSPRMKTQVLYDAVAAPQFEEKEFFEYHIYKLQRNSTLANNETKQIQLFETKNINVNKMYYFDSRYGYGGQHDDFDNIEVIISFDNNEKNGLGIPMPKGKVQVNKSDGESVEFVGEDRIDHTPKNERIKLRIGEAFDILAKEVMTDNKRITNSVNEQTFEATFKNRKTEDVEIIYEKHLGLNWEILSSSFPYEKIDAFTVRFKIPVKKDSEEKMSIKVRYNY